MIYKVGDMIQLGDEDHIQNSNLPIGFAGRIVEICEVTSNKYWFYAEYDASLMNKWYVYHEDCELYMPMNITTAELIDFLEI